MIFNNCLKYKWPLHKKLSISWNNPDNLPIWWNNQDSKWNNQDSKWNNQGNLWDNQRNLWNNNQVNHSINKKVHISKYSQWLWRAELILRNNYKLRKD